MCLERHYIHSRIQIIPFQFHTLNIVACDYELHWSRSHLVSLFCRPPWSCTGYQSRSNLNEIRIHLYLKLLSGSLYCLLRMDRWKLIAPCFFPCHRISKTWWKHPHVVVQLRRVNITSISYHHSPSCSWNLMSPYVHSLEAHYGSSRRCFPLI